jgi:hypothetical protein
LTLKTRGSWFLLETRRLQKNYITAAVVGDRTAAPNDSVKENSSAVQPDHAKDPSEESKEKDDQEMVRICDKLIGIFMFDKPTPTDWRRLLAFSRNWNEIGPHFYKRCLDRANSEDDPGKKHQLLRLKRKLKEIDDDVQRHNELFMVIKSSPQNINEVVAKRRKDFTKEFFTHVYTVAQSYHDDPDERNDVENIGKLCLVAVHSYDALSENSEAVNAATLKFEDILKSASPEDARKKIDDMAQKNQIDPLLTLTAAKAWSAAKETNLMKDEAKDIMYHLYKTGVGNLQREVPKEVRILKYLLRIEDPDELLSGLNDAFTPGEEHLGDDIDCLYTEPGVLYSLINMVVDAYYNSQAGTVVRQAQDLVNPVIVQKLLVIKKSIQDHYM